MSFSQYARLSDLADYSVEKTAVNELNFNNYVSTENLLPNYGRKIEASSLPTISKVTKYSKGDILVSNIRPYFKKIWYAREIGGASNDVIVFRPKKGIDSVFLYYNLASDKFFDYVMSGAKGTKMPRGDKSHIKGFLIPDIPRIEQQAIARILSTLDDKIEVNNRINNTLENMAQEIFKRWFVDFEFPNEEGEPYKSSGGEMVESELGLIPKEWNVKKIGEMCEVTSSKRIFAQEYVSYGVPFYRGKEIIEKSKGNSITTELYISKEKYSELRRNNPVPQKGDMLLTSVGTLGKAYIVGDEEFYFKDGNLTWFRDYQNEGYSEYIYWWIKSKSGIEMLDAITIGSTQKALTINVLKNIKLVISDNFLSRKFYPLFAAINNNIKNINKENESIRMTRDLLLPKLMSGEIRVPLEES